MKLAIISLLLSGILGAGSFTALKNTNNINNSSQSTSSISTSTNNNANSGSQETPKESANTSNNVNNSSQSTSLSQEGALELLKKINGSLEYKYMGNEESFEKLIEKGLKGYVFFPKGIDTDLGYFVNKETKEVFKFHLSRYMELVK